MTEKFNKTTVDALKGIRKPMPPSEKTIRSKKDKEKRRDIKKGRKPWRYDESHKIKE